MWANPPYPPASHLDRQDLLTCEKDDNAQMVAETSKMCRTV